MSIADIVRSIPKGGVATFGDISCACYGHRNGGRGVGSAVEAETNKKVKSFPWWRVVHKGLIPKDEEARKLHECEYVKFCNGAV